MTEVPSFELFHYWRSSCSWRVRWALHHKGLSYKSVATNLLEKQHQTGEFLEKNPMGLVPALVVGDESFGQSLAMLEYLEEIAPEPPLAPRDPLQRMRVRELMFMVACDIQPLQNLGPQRYFSDDPDRRLDYARHWIGRGFAALEKRLAEVGSEETCFPGGVTWADLCLIPQVYNARRFKLPEEAYPRIFRIYEHCLGLPACQAAAPENQPGASSAP